MPEVCPISQVEMTNPALDHDHNTGLCRGCIDREANAFMGRVENAYKKLSPRLKSISLPEMLLNMSKFIQNERTNILHPKGAADLVKRFRAKSKDSQIELLEALRQYGLYVDIDAVLACKNTKERTELYEKALKSVKWQPKVK